MTAYIECANCALPIRRPAEGSYPEAVEWVHIVSPVGEGNRWCSMTARTLAERKPA